MHRPRAIALAVSSILLLGRPGRAAEKTLADYKTIFEERVAAIAAEHHASREAALEAYGKNLAIAKEAIKKRGDLEGTIAANREIERFEREQTVPGESPEGLPPLLVAVHKGYHDARLAAEAAEKKHTVDLITKYVVPLEALKKRLVQQGKLEEAGRVAREIKRVQFIQADLESRSTVAPKHIGNGGDGTRPHRPSSGNRPFPEGTVEFKRHHYWRLPLRHTFAEAGTICEQLGGHVVSISHSQEYAFIQELVEKESCNIWLDLTDEKKEGIWKNWRGRRPSFLKWQKGEPNDGAGKGENAVCLSPKRDMVDISRNAFRTVVCEWEPGSKPVLDGIDELGLCEVTVKSGGGVSVQTLKPGVARLSGSYTPSFSRVSSDLVGAQFLRVPWKSRPTHSITVTKAGYLYAYKIDEWSERDKLTWEHIGDAVGGAYHGSGAYRTRATKRQTLTFRSYESGVIAAKITQR